MIKKVADFENKIAVITGASSGIGKAIALGLFEENATVCLIGQSIKELKAVVTISGKAANNVFYFKADFEIDNEVHALADNFTKEFDSIDILVHSAGIISCGKIDQASIDDFDRQYKINVRAPYRLTQALLPMLRAKKGQIVFINSSAGCSAKAGAGQYSATKHALKAFADSLRAEVSDDGVSVMSVYPGRTATPMQEYVFMTEGRKYTPDLLLQPEDVAKVVIEALKLPRTAEITDIMLRPAIKLE